MLVFIPAAVFDLAHHLRPLCIKYSTQLSSVLRWLALTTAAAMRAIYSWIHHGFLFVGLDSQCNECFQ